MRRHIENLKEQPEHIRRRVAIGVSAGVTGLVAVVWFAAHAAMGTFALSSPPPPGTMPEDDAANAELADAKTNFSQLTGAVGSAFGGGGASEPELTIVDGNTTSTIRPAENHNQTDATVIPF